MNRLLVGLLISGVLLAAPTAGLAGPCRGDCDADGRVDVDELVLGVGVALGARPVAECSGLDDDQNGRLRITSETPGASIGYTLDEEAPPRWKLYTGEFLLPKSGQLRAKAIRYGFAESAPVEATFEIR